MSTCTALDVLSRNNATFEHSFIQSTFLLQAHRCPYLEVLQGGLIVLV